MFRRHDACGYRGQQRHDRDHVIAKRPHRKSAIMPTSTAIDRICGNVIDPPSADNAGGASGLRHAR
jgi:hypothetical protein